MKNIKLKSLLKEESGISESTAKAIYDQILKLDNEQQSLVFEYCGKQFGKLVPSLGQAYMELSKELKTIKFGQD